MIEKVVVKNELGPNWSVATLCVCKQLAPVCVPVLSRFVLSQQSGVLAGILEYLWVLSAYLRSCDQVGTSLGGRHCSSGLRGAILTGIYPPKLCS